MAVLDEARRAPDDAPAPPPPPGAWGYRPHLDGLRAVAVYLVVLYHAGVSRFAGGFIGVDVFFVLSGYVVTRVLLRDLHTGGRVRLSRFYARRFRRLLPAAFATLLITSAVFAAIASPREVRDALDAVRAAFLYVANWFFIHQSNDYFAANVDTNPVLHFWSLSVEEQFYACWPLLLSGLFVLTRPAGARQVAVIRAAVVGGIVLSLVAALRLADSNLARSYYGTDARAYQLLAGAVLALTPALCALPVARVRRAVGRVGPLAFVALVVLATSAVDVGPVTRGVGATVCSVALIVALENAAGGPLKRGLSANPVVYLGRISYGTYLWHWPVIVVISRSFDLSTAATLELTLLCATALASLSYQMLERPIREARWLDSFRTPVVVVGLSMSVLAAIVLAPALLQREESSKAVAASGEDRAGVAPVPADLDWEAATHDAVPRPNCVHAPISKCEVVRGARERMLLLGDSHALSVLPAFEELAKRESISLSAAITFNCPWQLGMFDVRNVDRCRGDRDDWYERLVPELDPDIVVLAGRPFDDPDSPLPVSDGSTTFEYGDPGYERVLVDASTRTIARLQHEGRKVVAIEPVPTTPNDFDPTGCLSEAKYLDDCRYVAHVGPTPVERAYREAARRDGVWDLNLDHLVCPYFPICDPVVHGMVVKQDHGHLTATYARSISDEIERYLRDNEVL